MPRARKRKGIVGIEAAIVMIAFVIVAAALAFVALNMGMTATQKTKEAITSSLGEAGSALMVDGDVMAYYNGTTITDVVVPIRLSSGKYPVDLQQGKTVISVQAGSEYYASIQFSVYPNSTTDDLQTILTTTGLSAANTTQGAIVFLTNDGDQVLEFGEKALVIVHIPTGLQPYDPFKIEIKPPEGAPLVVERVIPPSLPGTAGPLSLG